MPSTAYLSKALTNYFTRSKGKIVFRKGLSLNGLALAMWEESNTCGVDASILSKVLCGKRLFTPQQLSIFCKVLGITRGGKEHLFYCLHQDYDLKGGVRTKTPFVSPAGTHQFVGELMQQADTLFLAGKWKDLYQLCGIMESYLHDHVATTYHNNPEDTLITTYQNVLYWRAKSSVSIQTQDAIMPEMRSIARKLNRYTNSAFARLTPGYIESFNASAYRVLGLFPTPLNPTFNRKYAVISKNCAAKAVQVLPPTDYEYLASLRNILDSSIMLGQQDEFVDYLKVVEYIWPLQPEANFLSSMQLAATVGKGKAVFKLGDPFALKEQIQGHFGRSPEGMRVFELADIKAGLETHIALGSRKDASIEQKIQRALTLATEESERYKGVIEKLASQF